LYDTLFHCCIALTKNKNKNTKNSRNYLQKFEGQIIRKFWDTCWKILQNITNYCNLIQKSLQILLNIRAPVAEWSKVLGFYRFATSAPGSNLVRPAKSFHRIYRVLECTSTTLSSRCSIGRLLMSLSIWETVKMHAIEFSYTEQLKLSGKKRSTTYYNNYNV
jgi:hypothetical protein